MCMEHGGWDGHPDQMLGGPGNITRLTPVIWENKIIILTIFAPIILITPVAIFAWETNFKPFPGGAGQQAVPDPQCQEPHVTARSAGRRRKWNVGGAGTSYSSPLTVAAAGKL